MGTDASGIALGNIIGSNLSQITLLLGITGLIEPLTMPRNALRRDGTMLVLAMLAMLATSLDGVVQRWEGGLLVLFYGGYVLYLLRDVRYTLPKEADADRDGIPDVVDDVDEGDVPRTLPAVLWELGKLGAGMVGVVFCADLVVDQGVVLAEAFGLDDSIIGLGVGLGTGLPELTVAIRGIMKKASGMSLGNLIGSNITDPLLSFGSGVLVAPITVAGPALWFDFPVWIASTALAVVFLANDRTLSRVESGVLVAVFAVFAVVRLGWLS